MTKYLISDLSTITTISENSLHKLAEKSKFIICHDVCESIRDGEDTTVIEIGIGTISIHTSDEGIKYRFAPSPSLDNSIKDTVLNGKNPLVYELENALVNKIEKANKELF